MQVQTSYNRTVTASPPYGGSGYVFARSVALFGRSFPRKNSATLSAARLAAGNVSYLERYAPYPRYICDVTYL